VSPRLDLRLAGGPKAASAARHALEGLRDYTDPQLMENIRLLVSELVTNSIRHAGVGPEEWIRLTVDARPESVRVQVCDPGDGFEPRVTVPTVGQSSGWGLFLVEQLADRWGVEKDDATCVWFEIGARAAS
jgi:anti-sigma regulatory factor (Ser/Thr protein kinase)